MFYFQQLLNQGLAGIDRTSMIAVMVEISYTVLLIGFLIGIYQAALRGGDLQALAVTAIKYLAVAFILANWTSAFREVNTSFNNIAQFIDSASGAGDMFASWMDQLKQQFQNDGSTSFLSLIQGGLSALTTVLLVFVSYLIYALAVVVFGFFYTLYGCVLYVLGPLVLALMPIPGVGQIAKSFASNLLIWNSWGLLYAIFASLITAIQANRVENLLNGSGFMGFFTGSLNTLVLGLISIFYALALILIPFIAKRIVSGDVGSTAYAIVSTGAAALGMAISAGTGFAAGAGAGASGGAGAGSSAGAASAGAGASSSSTPPPQPNIAGTIRSGMMSAVNGGAPPTPASNSGSSASESSSASSSGSTSSDSTSGYTKTGSGSSKKSGSSSGSSGSNDSHKSFRPVGVGQQVAFHAGRFVGSAMQKATNGNGKDENA